MKIRAGVAALSLLLLPSCGSDNGDSGNDMPDVSGPVSWGQWGQNAQHAGVASVAAQSPDRLIVERVVDPFVPQETAQSGRDSLLVHYPVPLSQGDDVFLMSKGGQFTGSANWASQDWGWTRLRWNGDQLNEVWSYRSDWKPVPSGGVLPWEPVHQAALAGAFLYVPGAAGSVIKLNARDGSVATRISPFGSDSTVFVTGPLTADGAGNIYYNALKLDLADPWHRNAVDSWLVKVSTADAATMVRYHDLVPNAPSGQTCLTAFTNEPLPWPPSTGATPPATFCGAQRPGVNVAPVLGTDGTIYTVSRAHFTSRYGYLVAVNSDLTPRWAASLRERIADGCGVAAADGGVLPPNGAAGGCRSGARYGVDPTTNRLGSGEVTDLSSSTPVVAPDGAILYGAYTRYNYSRGHLMKFDANGHFLAAYEFGWDTTPAVHGSAADYSIVLKDNHYDGVGSYCGNGQYCTPHPLDGQYYVTRLDGHTLRPEWQFLNPNGTEWCINAPALDQNGDVFGIAEDGYVYGIAANGQLRGQLFLEAPLGAAYTPLSIDAQGRLYAQNAGHFFAVGR